MQSVKLALILSLAAISFVTDSAVSRRVAYPSHCLRGGVKCRRSKHCCSGRCGGAQLHQPWSLPRKGQVLPARSAMHAQLRLLREQPLRIAPPPGTRAMHAVRPLLQGRAQMQRERGMLRQNPL